MEKIEILPMQLSDLDQIKDILEKKFDSFWNYEIFKEEIAHTNVEYIIAKQANEIIGFAGIKIILDEADVMNIVTRMDKRHIGTASAMLMHLISLSKDLHLKSLTLEVNEKNIPALTLYQKYNFKQVGLRKNYYNGTDNAILMSLSLL